MRKIGIVISIMFSAILVNAQSKSFSLSIGGGLSSLSSGSSGGGLFGYGADIQASTDFSEKIQGFLQTGYHSYGNNDVSIGNIPFLVGVNYKAGNFRPGVGLGYSSFSGGGSGGFSFSPQFGYNLNKVDLILHYTTTSVEGFSYSVFGLKVLYQIL